MKNLANLRQSAGYTQASFARQLGMPKTTYAHYESGRNEANIETLTKFADFFGVSIDYLLGHATPNILHLDGLTESQKKLIDLAQRLDDKQAEYISGRISELLHLSYEQAKPARPF